MQKSKNSDYYRLLPFERSPPMNPAKDLDLCLEGDLLKLLPDTVDSPSVLRDVPLELHLEPLIIEIGEAVPLLKLEEWKLVGMEDDSVANEVLECTLLGFLGCTFCIEQK